MLLILRKTLNNPSIKQATKQKSIFQLCISSEMKKTILIKLNTNCSCLFNKLWNDTFNKK